MTKVYKLSELGTISYTRYRFVVTSPEQARLLQIAIFANTTVRWISDQSTDLKYLDKIYFFVESATGFSFANRLDTWAKMFPLIEVGYEGKA